MDPFISFEYKIKKNVFLSFHYISFSLTKYSQKQNIFTYVSSTGILLDYLFLLSFFLSFGKVQFGCNPVCSV